MMARRTVHPSAALLAMLAVLGGCQLTPNFFRETGPSTTMSWDSPTAVDIKTHYEPSAPRYRDFPPSATASQSGIVQHYPLYFEDPFEDKGNGRTDETSPGNVYHAGWEDYVALPYGLARFTLNWLLLPGSAVVTPPWTVMESDGYVSRQLLGYDHDAIPSGHPAPSPKPESEPEDHDGHADEPATPPQG